MKKALFIITTIFTIFILAITVFAEDSYSMNYKLLYKSEQTKIIYPSINNYTIYNYQEGYNIYEVTLIDTNTTVVIYYNDGFNRYFNFIPSAHDEKYTNINQFFKLYYENNTVTLILDKLFQPHTTNYLIQFSNKQNVPCLCTKINENISPTFIFNDNTDYYIQPYIPNNIQSDYFLLNTVLNLNTFEKYYLYVYTTENIEMYQEFFKGKSSFNKEFVSYSRINQTATSPATISGTYPITDGNNNRKVNLYKYVLPKLTDEQSYQISYISQLSSNLNDTSKNIYFKYIILTDDSDQLPNIDQQYQIGQFNGIYDDYINGNLSVNEAIENLTDISNELIINDNTSPDERQFYIAYYDYTKTKIQENEINIFNQEQSEEYDNIIDQLEEFESIENLVEVPDLDDIRLEFNFPSEWANLSIDVWDISSSLDAIGAAEVIQSIFEIPIIMYLITLSLTLGIISLIVYGRRYT